MSRTTTSSFRPTLEALETRDLPSAAGLTTLFSQSVGQIATQMNNALSLLRSDSTNLTSDLRGGAPTAGPAANVLLQDYSRTAYDYGQVQGFSQALSVLGSADLAFLTATGEVSTSDTTSMLSLLTISKDLSSANKVMSEALSLVNRNPSFTAVTQDYLSVLAFLS